MHRRDHRGHDQHRVATVDGDTTVTTIHVTVVIVGTGRPSAIHIEKTVAPLTLPAGGGDVTYTYVVSNPGDST